MQSQSLQGLCNSDHDRLYDLQLNKFTTELNRTTAAAVRSLRDEVSLSLSLSLQGVETYAGTSRVGTGTAAAVRSVTRSAPLTVPRNASTSDFVRRSAAR
jgi:hypothetical protein